MVGMNAQMAPDLQTVFLPSQPACAAHLGHARAPDSRNGRRHLRLRSRNRPQSAEKQMTMIRRAEFVLGIVAIAFAAVFAATPLQSAYAQSGTPHLMLELKDGTVDIELLPDLAPLHVERVVELTEAGFYDGIVFHRVIQGFMAQTGDPTGTGMGGSDLPDVVAEFNETPFDRGVLGAARTNDPNTFNSQFFITLRRGAASSTASTPCSARWSRAWSSSTTSSRARPPTTAPSTTPTRSSPPRSNTAKEGPPQWPTTKIPRTPSSSRPPRAASSSRCAPTWRPTTSRTSRSWRAKAPTTASCFTA